MKLGDTRLRGTGASVLLAPPPSSSLLVSARGLGLLPAGALDQGCRQTLKAELRGQACFLIPTQHSRNGLQRCVGGAAGDRPLGFHLRLRYNPSPWSTPQVPAAASCRVTHKAGVVLCVQATRRRVERKTCLFVRRSCRSAHTGDVCMAQMQRAPPSCARPVQHRCPSAATHHPLLPLPPGWGFEENGPRGLYLLPLSCLKDTVGSWLAPSLGLRLCLWPPGPSAEAHSLWGALLDSDHSHATHSG